MSIDKEELDKISEFHKTVETQWVKRFRAYPLRWVIQQKWANELGEEEWRDIPLVISE